MKKLLMGSLAFAVAAPMFMSPIFAADANKEGTADATVEYDGGGTDIPDPDNPTDPHWIVTVHPDLKFTDAVKTQDVSVGLSATEGYTLDAVSVDVKVASKHAFNLTLNGGSDLSGALPYILKYDGKGITSATAGEKVEVSTLTKDKRTVTGTATLNGTALDSSKYKDVLTYSVSKKVV